MRLVTVQRDGREESGVVTGRGIVPIRAINAYHGTSWPTEMLGLLKAGLSERLPALAEAIPDTLVLDSGRATYGPPFRRPRKIWGIGLNYREHADDLSVPYPTEPASFMKGDHTIIGPGDTIQLPEQSKRVTAEGELGVIIGRTCYKINESEAKVYIAGVCLVLDQTAEDILRVNPRFLTRAKNFPGFLSFGPQLVTIDESGDLNRLRVATVKNGVLQKEDSTGNMMYSPYFLVAFHSEVMPLYPGDIILTGTPGATVIEDGDLAECRISGLGVLQNPVHRPGEGRHSP